ncbi:MAG: response regulator transcription factor [Lysobacterales bacterium]
MTANNVVVGLLEDDPDQAELLRLWLEQAGYQVRWYCDSKDFRRRLGAESIDLLLLDWNLGDDSSGIEVLEWMRESAHQRLPVIFLTARNNEQDIVAGLQAGADDYVVKPAKRNELLARIQVILRRSGVSSQPMAWASEIEPYVIDIERRSIRFDERPIELTDREFDLAMYMFRRHSRIVSRESLLENVWNLSADVNTRTVDTHVSRLRRKLELNGDHGWVLNAVYQHGYRLEPAKQRV